MTKTFVRGKFGRWSKKKNERNKRNICGGRGNQILLRPKNILATSEVINKQTKIKKCSDGIGATQNIGF